MGDIFKEVDRELAKERLAYRDRYTKIGLALLTGVVVIFVLGIAVGFNMRIA